MPKQNKSASTVALIIQSPCDSLSDPTVDWAHQSTLARSLLPYSHHWFTVNQSSLYQAGLGWIRKGDHTQISTSSSYYSQFAAQRASDTCALHNLNIFSLMNEQSTSSPDLCLGV